jgi:hypothetical protein
VDSAEHVGKHAEHIERHLAAAAKTVAFPSGPAPEPPGLEYRTEAVELEEEANE